MDYQQNNTAPHSVNLIALHDRRVLLEKIISNNSDCMIELSVSEIKCIQL